MKKFIIFISILVSTILLNSNNILSQTKLAQTGMKFLSVSTDARVSAMGNAITSVYGYSASMFYNPAGMAKIDKYVDVSFGQTSWIADINYMQASAAFQPFGDNYYGVFGISVVAVDYGDLQHTVRADNELGYLDLGTFSPSALAIGVSYARSLSEKFSVGGSVKYIRQSLGNGIVGYNNDGGYQSDKFQTDVMAFDFGVIYSTGFKSLNIGMSIRNFSREIRYVEESFQLPLTFQLGVSIDAIDLLPVDHETHSLLISFDASHPRDFKEQVHIGGEYTFSNFLSLRGGYFFPSDQAGFTAGIGVKKDFGGLLLGVDYAYAPFGIFSDVHRFSVRIAY